MEHSHWIFISPHFDDVVLSCGGLIWDLTRTGQLVEIWTIMAGYPTNEEYSAFAQQNHRAWGKTGKDAINMRREEDHAACKKLGAQAHHFDWLDVIYRVDRETGEPLVNNVDELFGKPPEEWLVNDIGQRLAAQIPESSKLVMPMGLGSHIDHRVVVEAGKQFLRADYYFADYPYILKAFSWLTAEENRWSKIPHPLDEDALIHWQDAVLCYSSQLSGFWRDETEARLALRNYLAGSGGRLWQKSVVPS